MSQKQKHDKVLSDLFSGLFKLIVSTLFCVEIRQRGISKDLAALGTFDALRPIRVY